MAVAKPLLVDRARRFCIPLRNHLLALSIVVLLAICGGFDHRHIANERDYLEHSVTRYANEMNEIEQLAEDLQVHTAHPTGDAQVMLKDDELIKRIDAHRHKRHNMHSALHAGDRGKVVDGAKTQ
jgi:hypothetical protein